MPKNIVILHGWGRGAKSYEEAKKLLEEKGYQVHLFDLPGFGEAPPPRTAWSVDDYADFVLEYVESRNLDEVFLWGNSFGGRIAIKFAVKHPEKLSGVILCVAAGIKHELNFRQNLARLLAQISKPIAKIIPIVSSAAFADILKKIVYRLAGVSDYRLAVGVMKDVMKKTNEEDLTTYLSQINIPTLIIWGEKDSVLPLADAYVMHNQISGSHLEILKGIDHRPHRENPGLLVEKIDEFIKSSLKP